MDPVEALDQIATLLERQRAGRYKEEAFRKAADAIRGRSVAELQDLAEQGRLGELPGIGSSTARVIAQALEGEVPEYLARLEAEAAPDAGPGAPIRAALQGDLHLHSDWSDGGATVEQMARTLYRSLTKRLLTLPDYLVLYPSHYSGSVCGRGLSANPISTIGFERRHNPALQFDSEDAFAQALLRDIPPAPEQQAAIIAANRSGRPRSEVG